MVGAPGHSDIHLNEASEGAAVSRLSALSTPQATPSQHNTLPNHRAWYRREINDDSEKERKLERIAEIMMLSASATRMVIR